MRALATEPGEERWLLERTGAVVTEGVRGIKAVDGAGRIRGMVLYDGWTPNSVQAHMAVDTPVAWRGLLPAVFKYPFEECGKGLLLGIIPAGNIPSNRMVYALGFRETHRVKNGWALGEDLVLWEMRRADCTYLEGYRARRPYFREDSPLL